MGRQGAAWEWSAWFCSARRLRVGQRTQHGSSKTGKRAQSGLPALPAQLPGDGIVAASQTYSVPITQAHLCCSRLAGKHHERQQQQRSSPCKDCTEQRRLGGGRVGGRVGHGLPRRAAVVSPPRLSLLGTGLSMASRAVCRVAPQALCCKPLGQSDNANGSNRENKAVLGEQGGWWVRPGPRAGVASD